MAQSTGAPVPDMDALKLAIVQRRVCALPKDAFESFAMSNEWLEKRRSHLLSLAPTCCRFVDGHACKSNNGNLAVAAPSPSKTMAPQCRQSYP